MKVCFIYDPETNERYLEILSKMTPGRSGVWKDMVGVTRIEDADWCVVIDETTKTVPLDRTLFVSAHPKMDGYTGYSDNTNKPHALDNSNTFGFGEWWLKHDYDTLLNMKCPNKEKEICCIMSNSEGDYGRTRRKIFAKSLGIELLGKIDGGKPLIDKDGYWFGKEDVYKKHKYALEVDVGPCRNYFSERFFDSILMWCLPLYWGGTNVEDYFPKESFRYVDIYGNGDDVLSYRNSGEWEKSVGAIEEARNLILNKYQLWARVYEYIKSL